MTIPYKSIVFGGFLLIAIANSTQAQSNEALLKTLVRKGVITEAEADALRKEATQEPIGAVPEWVQSISFKGDLRLRYEQRTSQSMEGTPLETVFVIASAMALLPPLKTISRWVFD